MEMKNLVPGKAGRILIRGTNWVGDAVMSIPALKEIRRLYPDAHLSLLVRPWVRDVYAAADFVDEILEFDKQTQHGSPVGLWRLSRDLRNSHFDMAILLQNAFEAAFLAWLAGIPVRVGYARDYRSLLLTHPCKVDPEVLKVHQIYYYLEMLSQVGLLEPRLWLDPHYSPSLSVPVHPSDCLEAKKILLAKGIRAGDVLVGINPGASYGGAKRWLSERFARVADELTSNCNVRVVIFGAPSERAVAELVASQMKQAPVVLAGETTLGQLMALIRQCSLFITNDSGPMHLAAALDVPQIAIFGSTSEIATGPLNAEARVIKSPVPCSPCFLRECPTNLGCMTGIEIDPVLAAAREKLGKFRAGFVP
jgi:heptosyltransferase-2